MYKYKVRPAGIADFAAVYRMNERILGISISKNKAEKAYKKTLMDASQAVFVAIHSGNAVGYIHAAQITSLFGEMHTEILNIAVYDFFVDKNAYAELVNAVLKWSGQMLSESVHINTASDVIRQELLDNGFCGSDRRGLEKIISERKNIYERMYT